MIEIYLIGCGSIYVIGAQFIDFIVSAFELFGLITSCSCCLKALIDLLHFNNTRRCVAFVFFCIVYYCILFSCVVF